MQALESLERKINSADKLLSIVKTMKALAAANMRQYEKAVESLGDYYLTVEMGLQVALKELNNTDDAKGSKLSHLQADKGSTIAVIFGSDYGFAGRFNDEIVAFALSELNKAEKEKMARVILVRRRNRRFLQFRTLCRASTRWYVKSSWKSRRYVRKRSSEGCCFFSTNLFRAQHLPSTWRRLFRLNLTRCMV